MEDHERKRARVGREEWAKRIERWCDSGLTAAEFAAELGINPRTLMYWKWTLRREAQGQKRVWRKRRAAAQTRPEQAGLSGSAACAAGLIEIQTSRPTASFELELARGHRLRVPATFDAAGLRRLLDVLEGS